MAVTDWRKSVVYQIYPKSFNDTTGDGQGDINGIIEKLDYLKHLGIDYIWLTPVYHSPMNDNGYDISDYYEINPEFGTKEDFRRLLDEAHARGIKIMSDIVINHTSTHHNWFVESRKSKDNPYRDYYIWKDGSKDNPPTNWESKFGGNAWEYDALSGQYYLRLFDVTQADLNWENESLRKEIYDMINYWIDFGIDGFRFDVINLISKGTFKDSDKIGKEFYTDGPRVHEFLHELNRNTFGDKEGFMTVGEMSSTTLEHCINYTRPERQELSSVFNFHHLKVDYKNGEKWTTMPFDFVELKRILFHWQTGISKGNGWNAIFWCNHDQPRVVSRFGSDKTEAERVKSAKMLAIVLHLLQGTPYIYQGEEIGMTNLYLNSIEDYRDVESLNAYQIMKAEGRSENEILKVLQDKSRDNSRSPVQWDDSMHAGFTTNEPWIKVADNYQQINVEKALKDENSIFYTYQKLIKLRHERDIITYGEVKPLLEEHKQLFVYERILGNQVLFVVANFSEEPTELPVSFDLEGEVLITNNDTVSHKIEPYQAFAILR
ncbi:alpha,alpha-phosphotrehalase [Macrococcoides caseolyticum]|uniref:alpha,alpha-phosphotrehalase n=1 Tax=Macrococcoides caseolyticum TaxID=69966 RepID=UPI000C328C6E|nr:alpha,alpha-phosphotrehalase [Macrococcus caseolyticus]PKE10734.1 alpha,alpha-phosphotrehalase [Macrococcus caseolyticus]PKE47150.1 alpha,alpha-phosphotrehalase [Macrococcus caseolyticus]PKF13896.1 alpha,alpha-phosphotrehalase [Macrococcus caseolyticus]PNZ71443.1 alpha,alpha-phosphotrehalase [Macrococcus caseolyticus]QPT46319.1 alpha,alpha-phosphotrehalase [Macrococcus caseolyticus]